MKSTKFGALLFFIALCNPLGAMAMKDEVQSFQLKNGMKFLVLEDRSIPNANAYLFWRVGSRNEYPGITGLSHFFEHMMFNGAKKYGPKEFDRVMEAAGGSNNAYTNENLTVYTDWFPAEQLDLMFELEADRIAHLAIDPQMVESERGVVMSERSTGLENSNFRAIWEEVKGAAFRAHPYSWSVIGHESDIANWSLQDLVDYHKTYYAPNNAVVVVAGDVEFEQVKALATKHFGPIPAQQQPREIHTVEPEQKGERRVYLHKASVSSPNIMMAFHVPSASHPDYYALSMLADILATGKTSRLQQTLVFDKELASNIFAYFPESIDPNLFYLYAVAAPNVSAQTLEQGIIEELQKIKQEGVAQEELVKIKNRKLVDFYREMATINGKANTIGTYEMYFGDYRALFNAPQAFDKVTADDIKRVATTYLRKANRTVGVLAAQEDSNENDL
ncbi:pitrilysin family protein [Aliiglaciecola sp. CAU 1673]|uniref:M16 family metallopeptidase n=1 Tax=Aliiglaciecola sp. CAU 1673 TaxID=3032595 RepID=UPI0023DA5EFF|nr:pitrilysin family protein [Aliiglaciecola sp. CAU 1673]MDF2179748.1 pitrilysin family protein [Aliiglaciecola sp. CAU 1673]